MTKNPLRKNTYFCSLGLIVIVFGFFVIQAPIAKAQAGWYDVSWAYRTKIIIDRSRVSGGSDLTDFPLLVSITAPNFRDVTNGGRVAQPDGSDILFTAADGTTKLAHEIERYAGASGALVVWVRLPVLSFGTDTELYVYYGNASAADQQNRIGAWDANYIGVYHMKETAGAVLNDATSRALYFNKKSAAEPNPAAGKIAGGQAFDGANDYVSARNAATSPFAAINSGDFTQSFWVSLTGTGNVYRWFISNWGGTGEHFGACGSRLCGYFGDNSELRSNLIIPSDGSWHLYTVRRTAGRIEFFKDGVRSSASFPNRVRSVQSSVCPRIGERGQTNCASATHTQQFRGSLDEAWFSNVSRSDGHITTLYNNQNSPASFYSLSAEETLNPVPAISVISPASKNKGDAQFSLTVTGSGFIPASSARFNGVDRATAFVDASRLTAVIPASDLASTGTFSITVYNPPPGGGTSNSQSLAVSQAGGGIAHFLREALFKSVPPPDAPEDLEIKVVGCAKGKCRLTVGFSHESEKGDTYYITDDNLRQIMRPRLTQVSDNTYEFRGIDYNPNSKAVFKVCAENSAGAETCAMVSAITPASVDTEVFKTAAAPKVEQWGETYKVSVPIPSFVNMGISEESGIFLTIREKDGGGDGSERVPAALNGGNGSVFARKFFRKPETVLVTPPSGEYEIVYEFMNLAGEPGQKIVIPLRLVRVKNEELIASAALDKGAVTGKISATSVNPASYYFDIQTGFDSPLFEGRKDIKAKFVVTSSGKTGRVDEIFIVTFDCGKRSGTSQSPPCSIKKLSYQKGNAISDPYPYKSVSGGIKAETPDSSFALKLYGSAFRAEFSSKQTLKRADIVYKTYTDLPIVSGSVELRGNAGEPVVTQFSSKK